MPVEATEGIDRAQERRCCDSDTLARGVAILLFLEPEGGRIPPYQTAHERNVKKQYTHLGILDVLGTFDPFHIVAAFLNCIDQRSNVSRHVIE